MKSTPVKTVPEALSDLGNLYKERNLIYGDNYKHFGKIMDGLFPDGLNLKGVDDFNRFGVFLQIVSKISRYAPTFEFGGHPDSLDDTSVYSQMLRELDGIIMERKNGARSQTNGEAKET
jgi:hypothetical protein